MRGTFCPAMKYGIAFLVFGLYFEFCQSAFNSCYERHLYEISSIMLITKFRLVLTSALRPFAVRVRKKGAAISISTNNEFWLRVNNYRDTLMES